MRSNIKILDFSGINIYLIKTKSGYILIDNGYPKLREKLIKSLKNAGVNKNNLTLIINTHGDHDHAGNALFLRTTFNSKIAMHIEDLNMVTEGNQDYNRKEKADFFAFKFKLMSLMGKFFDSGKFDLYTPDIIIDENLDLSTYGLDAKTIHLPGHSKGSIGVLTKNGDLFCGDLIYNFFKPEFLFIDNINDAKQSIEKLKNLNIKTVYPGHGKPFLFKEFINKFYNKEF